MQNTLYVKIPYLFVKKVNMQVLTPIFSKYGVISKKRFTNVTHGMIAVFTYGDPRDYKDACDKLKFKCVVGDQTFDITDFDPEITLENLPSGFWSFLLDKILSYSRLEYVIACQNGKKIKFRPHPNMWHGEENSGKECKGYEECDLPEPVEVEGPISYHIKKDKYEEEDLDFLMEEMVKKGWTESRIKRVAQSLLSFAEWNCRKTIVFLNEMTRPNDDHRGSDHTSIKLDWNRTFAVVPINGKITFFQLAEALYRVKSHKFDYTYELLGYSGITKISELNNCITISVNFDYGS